MNEVITIHKAKSSFSQLVAKAEKGEVIPICRGKSEASVALVKYSAIKNRLVPDEELFQSIQIKEGTDLTECVSEEFWGDLA